jgi:DNA-binding beta-propeller fold protein YncE
VSSAGTNSVIGYPIHTPSGTFGLLTPNAGFSEPRGIAINNAGTRAYVANYNGGGVSTINKCDISGGSLSCGLSHSSLITGPYGVALNPDGTILYVANNGDDSVTICHIDDSTGLFSSCEDSGLGQTFNAPLGIAINAAGTKAYIANNSGASVIACAINPNGTLSSCVTASNAFLHASYIAFN